MVNGSFHSLSNEQKHKSPVTNNLTAGIIFLKVLTRSNSISFRPTNAIKNRWHNFSLIPRKIKMNNWLRTLIAGYAGWKWGGVCLGFLVVFGVVYFLLGHVHC